MKTLSIAEIFYSIQGEGQTVGTPAYFIRLAGCNLKCGYGPEATWRCDSIEVWQKGKIMSFDRIAEELDLTTIHKGAHLIFTGGEPLLQQQRIAEFIGYLHDECDCNPIIEVETNATILPNFYLRTLVNYWNVSPKLNNSGMELTRRINIIALRSLSQLNTMFKFVVSDIEDWDEIVSDYLPHINRSQIWLMPAADNRQKLERVSEWLVELCKAEVLHFSTRLQIAIWNKTTGV